MAEKSKNDAYRGRPVTTISLDAQTRKRIGKELRIEREDYIPKEIRVVRVSREELGIGPTIFAKGDFERGTWILVDA